MKKLNTYHIDYYLLHALDGKSWENLKRFGVLEFLEIVMEPLRGGNLGRATPPPAVAAVWNESPVKRTPVEWALRWVWNRP